MKTVVLSALVGCALTAGAALTVRSIYRAQKSAAAGREAALEEEVAALRRSWEALEARLASGGGP